MYVDHFVWKRNKTDGITYNGEDGINHNFNELFGKR